MRALRTVIMHFTQKGSDIEAVTGQDRVNLSRGFTGRSGKTDSQSGGWWAVGELRNFRLLLTQSSILYFEAWPGCPVSYLLQSVQLASIQCARRSCAAICDLQKEDHRKF